MMSVDSDVRTDQETRLAELYCVCMETQSIERLLERAGHKILEILPADFVTYVDVAQRTMHVVGRTPSTTEIPRISAHANRCLEGTDKTRSNIETLRTLQYGTETSTTVSDSDADLLWTGAVEREGRLAGVLTLYGEQQTLLSQDKRALRSARTMLGDAIARLSDLTQIQSESDLANGVDVFVVSIDTSVSSGDVTGLLMSKLQDAIAKRLAGSIPDAFMVAKLGINRLMVVGHPDHPLPLARWETLCQKAVASLDEKLGYRLQLNLSEGDLEHLSDVPVCGLVSKPTLAKDKALAYTA